MHPRKAKVLATVRESGTMIDGVLQQQLHVALHPGAYGWAGSLFTAGVLLPLTGVNAILTDVSELLLERSDDSIWTRAFPEDADGELPDRPA